MDIRGHYRDLPVQRLVDLHQTPGGAPVCGKRKDDLNLACLWLYTSLIAIYIL